MSLLEILFGKSEHSTPKFPPPPPGFYSKKDEELPALKAEIKLGRLGRDKVTGFTGILTARVEYLTGCEQWGLTPKCDSEGKTKLTEYFDESRIEIIGNGVRLGLVNTLSPEFEPTGGPNRDAPR